MSYARFCAAFVGMLLATRIGIGNPTQGEGDELQAIASSVIGGTSLFGAVGSVHGPLIGSFILQTINNGANLLNVNSFWQTDHHRRADHHRRLFRQPEAQEALSARAWDAIRSPAAIPSPRAASPTPGPPRRRAIFARRRRFSNRRWSARRAGPLRGSPSARRARGLGEVDAAADAFRATLRLDAADAQGATARLAFIGQGDVPPGLPAAYVARLFDQYAPRFEAHLTGTLGYRAPALIGEALERGRAWPPL